MRTPKRGKSKQGKDMHYSVGAVIRKNGKYLLVDRVKPPFGFAGPAGHVDEGEDKEQALLREIEEESGLKIVNKKLLFEEELDWNTCSKGIDVHYWYVFECEVEGEVKRNYAETKSIAWYTKEDIKELKLEPVWKYWFEKIGVVEK